MGWSCRVWEVESLVGNWVRSWGFSLSLGCVISVCGLGGEV